MSDSEDYGEDYVEQPRVKRHRFKTFAERVADVEVDVYRQLGPVRDTPLGGAPSFTVEALHKWRELNSTAPFLEVASAINPITETLPQLVHHAEEVFQLLLDKTQMQFHLSLPAILALHAALARDLQEQYAQHMFPRLMSCLATLLNEQGGDKDTEVIEQVFTCVSMLCKHLARHLTPQLSRVLAQTQGLRYARSPHVRLFAAQAVGFLFRHVVSLGTTETTTETPSQQEQQQSAAEQTGVAHGNDASTTITPVRRALRALLAEHAVQPDEARTDGAGLLLAESVVGVSHGLHSRAPIILALTFGQDVVTPQDFNNCTNAEGFTQEKLRARATAVASVALERLLNHIRKEKADALWTALLNSAEKQLDYLEATVHSMGTSAASQPTKQGSRAKRAKTTTASQKQPDNSLVASSATELLTAYSSAARSTALVAQAVNYFKGSRVNDYGQIIAMSTRLMSAWAWPTSAPASLHSSQEAAAALKTSSVRGEVAAPSRAASRTRGQKRPASEDEANEPFLRPSLSQQTLRLVLGIIYGHCKRDSGLSDIGRLAPTWTACFTHPPPEELMPFAAGLLSSPAGPEVARLFAPRMLGSLGGLALLGSSETQAETKKVTQQTAYNALGLLVQVCDALQPHTSVTTVFTHTTLPLMMTAQPAGLSIAAGIKKQLSDWAESLQAACQSSSQSNQAAVQENVTEANTAAAWACLKLLPHCCENAAQAKSVSSAVRDATQQAMQVLQSDSADSATGTVQSLLFLNGTATHLLASCLAAQADTSGKQQQAAKESQEQLIEYANQSLQWLLDHPDSTGAAIGAAAMMSAVREHACHLPAGRELLSISRLQAMVPVLAPQLASSSQSVRAAVLQLLCSFDQPPLLAAQSEPKEGSKQAPGQSNDKLPRVEVLPLLLAINTEACTLEAGRRWSVALIRQGGHAEYNRIPPFMIPALMYGLLGVMRVRFSPLWPAAVTAIAVCLHFHTKACWPIFKEALINTQQEFLTQGTNTSGPSRGQHNRKGRGRHGSTNQRKVQLEVENGSEGSDVEQEQGATAVAAAQQDGSIEDIEGLAEGEQQLPEMQTLETRFKAVASGSLDEHRDSTDASNRLTHLLRSLAKTPSQVLEPLSKDWVPLFLKYADAPKITQGAQGGVSVLSRVGARVYRAQLSEWLNFLSGIKGARGMYKAAEVQVSVALQLDADEPPVQAAVLRCLQAFKHKYLNEHMERLLRLADNKTLRAELSAFPLAVGAEGGIAPVHRPGLLPLLIRLLFPKLRKRTGRLAGKGALGSARAAVLNFFAYMEPPELRPLIEALLAPLDEVFVAPANTPHETKSVGPGLVAAKELEAADKQRLLPAPWWLKHVGSANIGWWLEAVSTTHLAELPARRKVGFLNAFADLLEHLGHRLAPLLPALLGLTLRLFQEATQQLQESYQAEVSAGTQAVAGSVNPHEDRSKEIRSSCLKILSQTWMRFPGAADYNDAWGIFLTSATPLMARLSVEAAADKEPGLLSCALAIAASPNLLPILGNAPCSIPPGAGSMTQHSSSTSRPLEWPQGQKPAWAVQGLGGQLLRSCITVLNARNCSQASRTAVLDMLDCILEETMPSTPELAKGAASSQTQTAIKQQQPTQLFKIVLQPWIDDLLIALKGIITAAWEGKDITTSGVVRNMQGLRQHVRNNKRRSSRAHRELGVLERLSGAVTSKATARLLGDALAALVTGVITGPGVRRGSRLRLDEVGLSRALAALSALWARTAETGGIQTQSDMGKADTSSQPQQPDGLTRDDIEQCWEAMSPLALKLTSREARAALAAAYESAAKLLANASYERAAALMAELTAWSVETLDEPNYDARMRGYSALQVPVWLLLGRAPALPVVMICLHDLRNANDLALRQSAAAALERCITAAASTIPSVDSNSNPGSPSDMLHPEHLIVSYPKHPHAKPCKDADASKSSHNGDKADDNAKDDSLQHLVPRVLYPQLRSQLNNNSLAVRQEHLQLLRAMVLAFPDMFADLTALINQADPETDFFLNVSHLQLHRRVRAFNQFNRLARAFAEQQQSHEEGDAMYAQQPRLEHAPEAANQHVGQYISVRCIMDIAMPLLMVTIGEDAGSHEAAHDATQREADRTANVVDAAQNALAAASAALPWVQYDQVLSMFIRHMRASVSKASIRAVCQILDAFHFALPNDLPEKMLAEHAAAVALAREEQLRGRSSFAGNEQPGQQTDQQPETDMQAEDAEDEDHDSDMSDADQDRPQNQDNAEDHDESGQTTVDETATLPKQTTVSQAPKKRPTAPAMKLQVGLQPVRQAYAIQRALVRRVLPVLHNMLVKKGRQGEVPVARAPVALAIAKLVRLLPEEVERRELPRALGNLASLLLERQHKVRDDVRAVLVSMAKELGPRYMPYIINVLRATLPDRGFTAHVLGYTFHMVLEGVVGHLLSKKARAQMAALSVPTDSEAPAEDPNPDGNDEGFVGLDEVAADDADKDGVDTDDDEAPEETGLKQQGNGNKASKGQTTPRQQVPVGLLDDALELALPIIENEVFGHVAAAKEVAQFANNYKEARRLRGYESYMLLAASITFSTHIGMLMELIKSKLHMAGVPSVRNRLNHLLHHAVRGIHANPTATSAPLATWVHITLDEGLKLEEAARARAQETVGAAEGEVKTGQQKVAAPGTVIQKTVAGTGKAKRVGLSEQDASALHYHLLVDASLQLLCSAIRKGVLSGRSPAVLELLNPLLPVLIRILRGRHAPSVSLALASLSHMVTLPLSQLRDLAPSAGKAVTSILKRVPNAGHPLAQQGFRLLAGLMRECSAYQPSTKQVRFLLSWLFADRHADDSLERGPGFTLVRAILARKLVVPEVYDVMNYMQKLMVKSQAGHIRASAASCLLTFLLDYPLGPKRLASHLSFLASNLSYEYEDGRLQVLQMIQQVVSKFPTEVVAAHAELFLLPLVMRLVNDPSPKGRAAVAAALRALLAALPADQQAPFITFCKQWIAGDNAQLRRAGIQSLGLLAEAQGGARFAKLLSDPAVLAPLKTALVRQAGMSALQASETLDEEDLAGSCPGWHEAYYCLIMLEKVVGSAPSALPWPISTKERSNNNSQSALPQLWDSIQPLLLHKHAWVRKAAARLLGLILAQPSAANGLMSQTGRPAELAFALFMQLNCSMADEATCKQAVKCLIPVAVRLQQEHQSAQQEHQADVVANGNGNNVAGQRHDRSTQQSQAEGNDETGLDNGQVHQKQDGNDQDSSDEDRSEDNISDDQRELESGDADADGDANNSDQEDEHQEDDQQGTASQQDGGQNIDPGSGDEEDIAGHELAARALSLPGLMRRMARLADNARFSYVQQRLAALRWIAAIATKLGADGIKPYLSDLMVPLYRLSEAAEGRIANVPAHTQDAVNLGQEVLGHLRTLMGADVVMAAYNAARETVRNRRSERKKREAVKVLLDPETVAASRLKKGRKKSENRKRKQEEVRRERSARTYMGGKGRSKGPRSSNGSESGGRRDGGGPRSAGIGKMYGKRMRDGGASKRGGRRY